MTRLFRVPALLALLVFACLLALPRPGFAEEDNILNMYVAYGGPEEIAVAFKEATGITVNFLTMSSGEVLTRLRAEKQNPGSDVWFGGGSDAFIQAATEELIAPYVSPNAAGVAPEFKDEQGYWTGVSLVVVGFTVNTERLQNKGLPEPATWADLENPAFKDEILASNPNTSGTAYTTVSGVLQIKGEEEGWKALGNIYNNIPFLTKSGSAPGEKALAGEFAVGISPDPHNLVMFNPDAPLKAVLPSDGVLAWPSPVAMIANCKHPENARKFIDWTLTPEGQLILMKASPRVPTTNVEPLPGVPSLTGLNLVPYDLRKWGAARESVVEQFNQTFPQFR